MFYKILEHKNTILLIVLIAVCTYFGYNYMQDRNKEPKVITQEVLDNPTSLAKEINVSKGTAKEIQKEIHYVTQKEPTVTYTVQAPNTYKAAEIVEKQIKNNDQSIPKEALEESDRTIVTSKDTKVDVYKINLEKNTRIKIGATNIDDKTYSNIAIEHKNLEVIYHYNSNDKGISVMYTIAKF